MTMPLSEEETTSSSRGWENPDSRITEPSTISAQTTMK